MPVAELNPQYVPFPRVISQLLGGKLIMLEHFHHGRGSAESLLHVSYCINNMVLLYNMENHGHYSVINIMENKIV